MVGLAMASVQPVRVCFAKPPCTVVYTHQRQVCTHAKPNDEQLEEAQRSPSADLLSEWERTDDRNRRDLVEARFEDNLPLPLLTAVSTFGTALTGYLTWSKLTNTQVVCPVSGCSGILNSQYSQIGPIPLSALGVLGYGTVASLCVGSIAIKLYNNLDVDQASVWLKWAQRGVLYVSSILAGTSIALAGTLRAEFPGEFCAFCVASICSSLALYFISAVKSEDSQRPLSFGSVVASTLVIAGIYAASPADVTARSEIPFVEPEVTTVSPEGAVDLARLLQDRGAKMYGAFWCSHCFEQKQAFGMEAKGVLPYVECYPDGYKGPKSISRTCVDADVQGFPTWIINGQKVEGDWPLAYLQSVVNGADPREEAKKYPE